jgi:hypothetical protein
MYSCEARPAGRQRQTNHGLAGIKRNRCQQATPRSGPLATTAQSVVLESHLKGGGLQPSKMLRHPPGREAAALD